MEERVLEGYLENVVLFCSILYHASQGGKSCTELDSEENFKPEHTLFCRELRFVAIYALFGDLWAKKVPFWVKNSVSWARSALLHGIYCIFH